MPGKTLRIKGARESYAAALRDHFQQASPLAEHLLRVLRAAIPEGAVVVLQPGLERAGAVDVLLQDAGADPDVRFGVPQRRLAAEARELRLVVLRDDLHQSLRADHAFGDRVEARFDGDHG